MNRTLFALLLTACAVEPVPADALPAAAEDTASNQLGPPRLALWPTCGDPVCRGYTPQPGVRLCGNYTEGDRCPQRAAGMMCDPVDQCNRLLECRRNPDPGPCPISRAKHKHDISYLDNPGLEAAAQQAFDMKLATWAYNWDAPTAPAHLGFIIDDAPNGAAVAQDGEHVDLYGYTSITLAAVQVQQRKIAEQQAQIDALQAELAEIKRALRAR